MDTEIYTSYNVNPKFIQASTRTCIKMRGVKTNEEYKIYTSQHPDLYKNRVRQIHRYKQNLYKLRHRRERREHLIERETIEHRRTKYTA